MRAILPRTDKQTGLICNERLNKYQKGRMPKEEFVKELVYLALESIWDLKYQDLPIVPSCVIEFRQLVKSERKDLGSKFWNENWEARSWLDVKTGRKTENKGNWGWLRFYKGKMRGYGDEVSLGKIVKVLDTYPVEEFYEGGE